MDTDHRSHDEHDDHGHDHDAAGSGLRGWFKSLYAAHDHSHAEGIDTALETSAEGIRALKISLVGLGITALLQAVIVVISGSVALLSDTLHNVADALTAVPLWIAFNIGRRSPTRRYTYGYGKAEDIAGIFIVVAITFSVVVAFVESLRRLVESQPLQHIELVIAAGVIGFIGNELVALYRIRVGRKIGSAALIADGLHARADGLTSLAVLFGAIGVALGYEVADPIAGLSIAVALLFVLKNAARDVFHRLMDAVDPELVDLVESTVGGTGGVVSVDEIRVRWVGHKLHAEVEIGVDGTLSAMEAHDVAVEAQHVLLHAVPRLMSAIVHTNPVVPGVDPHASIADHAEANR